LDSEVQGKPTSKSSARLLSTPPGLCPESACETACDDLAESTCAGSECGASSIGHLMDGIESRLEDVEWLHDMDACCALQWGSGTELVLPARGEAQFGGLQQDLHFGWQTGTSWTDMLDASVEVDWMHNANNIASETAIRIPVLNDHVYAYQADSADTWNVELYHPEATMTDLSVFAPLHASMGLGADTEWNQPENADMWNVEPYLPEGVAGDLSALASLTASASLHPDAEWNQLNVELYPPDVATPDLSTLASLAMPAGLHPGTGWNQPQSADMTLWHVEFYQQDAAAADLRALASHDASAGLGLGMESQWGHSDWSQDAFSAPLWNAAQRCIGHADASGDRLLLCSRRLRLRAYS